MSPRLRSYLFLLLNTICWGATFVMVKPALEYTTPFRLLLYRYLLATLAIIPVILYYWPKVKRPIRVWKKVTIIELFGTTLSLGLLYMGLAQASALQTSLIATTQPIFITIVGILFLKEKLQRHESIGFLIAFIATLLLTLHPFFRQTDVGIQSGALASSQSGVLLVLCSVLTTAVYLIVAKKYYHPYPKMFIASLGFVVGLVSFFFLSLAEAHFSLSILSRSVMSDVVLAPVQWAALYMAIFTSIIGLTTYIKGQDQIEASEASLFWYLQALVYLPLGIYLLHEPLYLFDVVALGGILVGVVIAEKRFRPHTARRAT